MQFLARNQNPRNLVGPLNVARTASPGLSAPTTPTINQTVFIHNTYGVLAYETAFCLYGYFQNTGNAANAHGEHAVAVLGRGNDSSVSQITMYGSESRMDAQGLALQYGGSFHFANWVAANGSTHFTGQTLVGLFIRSEIYQSNGTSPEYTGSNIGILINSLVGGSSQFGIQIGTLTGGTAMYSVIASNDTYLAGAKYTATSPDQSKTASFYHDGTNLIFTASSGKTRLTGAGGAYIPAGSTTNDARIGGMLTCTTSLSPTGNVGTGATTLMSYTLKANTLVNNGDSVRVRVDIQYANNTNSKTLTLTIGSTTIYNLAAAIQNGWVRIVAIITKTGTTAQLISNDVIIQTQTVTSNGTTTSTGAENLTTDLVIKVTGTGGATNDLVQYRQDIEYLPAP